MLYVPVCSLSIEMNPFTAKNQALKNLTE